MASKEQQHPFYKPLWRRIVIIVTIAMWLAFELYQGNSGLWIALAGGMLVYAVYTFLITWPKDDAGDDGAPPA
jgi:hypothetical protein